MWLTCVRCSCLCVRSICRDVCTCNIHGHPNREYDIFYHSLTYSMEVGHSSLVIGAITKHLHANVRFPLKVVTTIALSSRSWCRWADFGCMQAMSPNPPWLFSTNMEKKSNPVEVICCYDNVLLCIDDIHVLARRIGSAKMHRTCWLTWWEIGKHHRHTSRPKLLVLI